METETKLTGNELVAMPLVVVNDILTFLQKKPYDEVAKIINDIHTKSRIVTETPVPAPGTESEHTVEEAAVVPEKKKKTNA